MAHMMLLAKRASRGKRMTSLVGKAAEDDEAFWGHDVWNEEGSEADSYVQEEEKPDEFDSDFDETESEEESDSEEEKQATRTKKTQDKKMVNNRYKDPKSRANRNSDDTLLEGPSDNISTSVSVTAKKHSSHPSTTQPFTPRAVRDSTKAKTVDSDLTRKRKSAEFNDRCKYVRPEKPTFTQEQLLQEALHTEVSSRLYGIFLTLLYNSKTKGRKLSMVTISKVRNVISG